MQDNDNRRASDVQLAVLTERLTSFMEADHEWKKTIIEARAIDTATIANIVNELSIYKTVYKTIKFIGMAIAAVITFKVGDINGIWHRIFGG